MLCCGRKECPKTKTCDQLKNKNVYYKPKFPNIKYKQFKRKNKPNAHTVPSLQSFTCS